MGPTEPRVGDRVSVYRSNVGRFEGRIASLDPTMLVLQVTYGGGTIKNVAMPRSAVRDLRILEQGSVEDLAAVATMTPAAAAPPVQTDPAGTLRALDDLRSQGLITDAEYESRRVTVLDGLGTAAASPTANTSSAALNVPGLVTVAAGGLAVLGAFLPWITATAAFVGTIERNGIDGGGDGILVIVMGLALALAGVARVSRSGSGSLARTSTIIASAVLIVLVYLDFTEVNDRIRELQSTVAFASVGTGLIVAGLAGVLGIVSGAARSPADRQ